MTDPPLEQLDLLDTDYADILASSSYPALELRLLGLGVDPASARSRDFHTHREIFCFVGCQSHLMLEDAQTQKT